MRHTAGGLNRTWLAIIGLVALLLGLAGILLASGAAATLTSTINPGLQPAGPQERILPDGFQDLFASNGAAILVTIAAVLVGLLALMWLLAQIPKRQQARTYRLHAEDAVDGRTRCEPRVIADAVEADVEGIYGVTGASALLRGSASQPELNLDVKVDPRSDIRDIIDQIHSHVAPNLETALETPLRKTAVLINVSASKANNKAVVL
ncbi:Asp23/Gls24 family envelope stress response protein [Arthrobacter sp. TmT3-37]